MIKEKIGESVAIKQSESQKQSSKSAYVSKHSSHQNKVNSYRNTKIEDDTKSVNSSGTHKGGVIKTIVLPHEDFNRLGVEGQHLL